MRVFLIEPGYLFLIHIEILSYPEMLLRHIIFQVMQVSVIIGFHTTWLFVGLRIWYCFYENVAGLISMNAFFLIFSPVRLVANVWANQNACFSNSLSHYHHCLGQFYHNGRMIRLYWISTWIDTLSFSLMYLWEKIKTY